MWVIGWSLRVLFKSRNWPAVPWLEQSFWQWNRLFPRDFAEKSSPSCMLLWIWLIWPDSFDWKWNSQYDGNGLAAKFWQMESVLSGFSKVGTARPYNGWGSHFDNEIGFSQEFLLENHLLLPCYLGFDWLLRREWSGRSVLTNGKRHLCVNLRCFLFLSGLTIFLFFIFFLIRCNRIFFYI